VLSARDDLDRPPLSGAALTSALVRPGSLWTTVRVTARTRSTNADLVAAAATGEPEGAVLVAECQEAGRGRQGRSWVSPPRAGLTCSVLLRPALPHAAWGWLPLLAGVSVGRALGRVAGVETVLKWPNDVLVGVERRKVAGLLAETAGAAVVLGVGLNVSTRRAELPVAGATSLALEGAACTDRAALLVALLDAFAADYRDLLAGADVRSRYLAAGGTVGQRVRVVLPGGELTGVAVDVDACGRLVVDTGDGRLTALAAGDVTHLRPAAG
jgi:BirA family biotin operon repressor/biotin-[acetyl-CoA-carboxylase] ligase